MGGFGGDNYPSGTGLIRVDTTNIWDAHSLVAGSNFTSDGGAVDLTSQTTARVRPRSTTFWTLPSGSNLLGPRLFFYTPNATSYENFIRNPDAPFLSNSTLLVNNYNSFTNNGAGVTWIPFDMPGTAYQSAVAEIDPTTGSLGSSSVIVKVLECPGQ